MLKADAWMGAMPTSGAPVFYLLKPVMEPAKILRIWVAPWQDFKNDLHWPSYIFSELKPRTWAYGNLDFSAARPIVPYSMGAYSAPVVEKAPGSPMAGTGTPVSLAQPNPGQGMPAPADRSIFNY